MRPEERASKQIVSESYRPLRAVGTAIGAGIAGYGIVSKVLPFLNQLLPSALAVKGLSKVDPRFGDYFNGIVSSGYNIDEGLNFLRDKFQGMEAATKSMAQNVKNVKPESEMQRRQALKKFKGKKPGLRDELKTQLESAYGQPQQMQQPAGDDEQLLQAMAQILKM